MGALVSRADDLAALDTLLAGHRVMLERVIALAEPAPPRDRVTQRILNACAGEARAYLRRLEATQLRPAFHPTHGDLGLWGENGLAPSIRDLLSRAEFQAENGERLRAEFEALGRPQLADVRRDRDPVSGRERVAA